MQPRSQNEPAQGGLTKSYIDVRKYSEKLCEPLETEDFVPQPVVDVSPPKWHIAHTSWFFEEFVLKEFEPGYRVFDPAHSYLFNSYYDSVGKRTPRHKRGDLSRPTVETVFEYRRHVDEHMIRLLSEQPEKTAADLIRLGINHEQQHQELFLTDLKYTFGVNATHPVYRNGLCLVERNKAGDGKYVDVPAGEYAIGHSGAGFCFDNEQCRHKVLLGDFRICSNLVSNGDFIEFVEAGGYEDFRFWHSEGWEWVNANGIRSPLYWQRTGSDWQQFTLGGVRPIRSADPVCHISFYEAAAFAAWKGMRLPTEFEWEAASSLFDWGLRWEWTNSAYLPYPGFTVAKGAPGEYNAKFMVNQMVLKGGSVATPSGHSRKTYRNFFHPHLRWQFTGLRLAK